MSIEIGSAPATYDAFGRALVIRQFGARAAAWLIRTHRKRIRMSRERAVRFVIPAGAELVTWFDVAFSFLRDYRAAKWETSKSTSGGKTMFVIRWRGRDLPEVIRA